MDTSTQVRTPHHKGTTALFKNPLLEKLTRTHIAVPISIFVVFAVSLIYWALHHNLLSFGAVLIVFLAGFLTFTLVEYLVHRYVFHMGTSTKTKAKIQYTFHGVHHDYPKDKERLAMPPLVSVTISVLLFLVFKLSMGNYAFAFLPGFVVGYASYLLVHYAIHAYQPPKNFLKHLWINHGIHHYKDHERAFGVSSPLWDYIFGTIPKK
ncbi:MAG: sterol desaturase family protein [Cytophagales bacterium]|nr:sterol desaturase family protein [Cytophagales bacterium]